MTGLPTQHDPRRRSRRVWPSLLLLLLALAVMAGVGEAACRLAESLLMGLRWDWREICLPAEAQALVYRLAPDRETVVAGVPFRTNADGFRDRPFPERLSTDELRVVVLGDSLTAGFGVTGEEAFPSLLQGAAAGLARPRQTLRTLNLGVPGYNLEQLAALAELSIARHRPRLILLCLFANDLEKPFLARGADGQLEMPMTGLAATRSRSPRDWLRVHSYFYRFLGTRWDRLLRRTGLRPDEAEDQLKRLEQIWSDPNQRERLERVLRRAGEMTGDRGAHRRLVVVLLPALFQLMGPDPTEDPVRRALDTTCTKLEIPFIDLLTPLSAGPDLEKLFLADDPHPGPEGHRRFADLIAAGLETHGLVPLPRDTRNAWSEPVRVTDTPGNSHTAALHDRSLAFDRHGRPHLVWFDASDYRSDENTSWPPGPDEAKSDRIYEIYHAVLGERGWSAPTRLSPLDNRTSRTPDLLADPTGRLNLIYTDERTGTMGIYQRLLTPGGWSADRRISPPDMVAYKASSCTEANGRLHVVFPGQLDDRRDVIHMGPEERADPVGETPAGGRCFYPGMALDSADGSLHLVWKMTPPEGVPGVYHRRLARGGDQDQGVWGPVTRLTSGESATGQPAVWPAADGGVHLVWVDHRHGQPEIYYRLLGRAGAPEERVTFHHPMKRIYSIRHPSVAQGTEGPVHLVWTDSAVGNFEVFHKQRGDSGWSPTTRITRDTAVSMDASIYPAPDGTLHVVWDDQRDGNFEIYHATHPMIR